MQDPVLSGARSEHEGRGYVQSDDVVNAGFTQGEESFVRVQVVYDEPLPLDDYEGVDITRLTQELRPKSPYELNVMHITVDGKPIDDPGRSSSDVQRCTDVALDNASIQFRFDNLESRPRLAVAAHPVAVAVSDAGRRSCRIGRAFPDVRQLCELHRACRNPNLRAAAVTCRPCRSKSSRSTTRASRNGSRRQRLSRARHASSSTCCAPTTRREISTKRMRGRCGCTASRRLAKS